MRDQPSTLRRSKKQRTQERILANAVALFREHGIRRTRLSRVAQASEVSAATLFNYYATKGQLAEAWVRGEVERTLVRAAGECLDQGRSLRSAIRGACREVAGASSAEPVLRREAWCEAGRAAGRVGFDRRPLIEGLGQEQQSERVRGDIAAGDLADMLIEAIEGGLIAGLSAAEEIRAADLESHLAHKIQERVDLVLDGARKRNERVRLDSAPS